MQELYPNIIDNSSLLMKHIHKLLIGMFFITTFGFGQPTFMEHAISTSADYAVSVHAADVDGDGDMDVLSASFYDNKIAWYENDSSESFTEHVISTSAIGPVSVHAADVDGDGDMDVLSASYTDDKVAWFENDGSEIFTEHTISTSAADPRSIYVSDVNGDGYMDVLFASYGDNKIIWCENGGSESFTEHVISASAEDAYSIHATDVDGNGAIDVLSASVGDSKIAWYENDGSESFTEQVISTSAVGALSVHSADVDGDGDMDVLSASQNDDKIAWYENDGSESFTGHVISTSADGASGVHAADVDGDGDMDILSASQNDDKIAWYDNDGSESFTEYVISASADGAYSVHAADVDGDGDMDVLSASFTDNKIAWYEQEGTPTEEPEIISITDVPDDQGGWVYVEFTASLYDTPEETGQQYAVYRFDTFEDTSAWVMVTSGPAIYQDQYIFEVHTSSDSTSEDDGMTEFKAVASMNAGVFHSDPDSGYSVDNIAPGVPGGLMATALDEGIHLTWDVSVEEDFQYFTLEKSLNSEFQEYETFETIDTSYIDLDYVFNEINYYRLTAVDHAGNISEYSDVVEATVLAIDVEMIPEVFVLHQNYPNPFNPTTQIKYDLPEDALVNITIYDVMGRSIRSLVNNQQKAGYRSIQWNATNNLGEPVSAGMYIYMIQAGEFRQVRKMVLLK